MRLPGNLKHFVSAGVTMCEISVATDSWRKARKRGGAYSAKQMTRRGAYGVEAHGAGFGYATPKARVRMARGHMTQGRMARRRMARVRGRVCRGLHAKHMMQHRSMHGAGRMTWGPWRG